MTTDWYSSPEWKRTRKLVLQRDNYTCQLKLPGCTYIGTEAHHTLGREITGLDMTYIVASCRTCNRKVGKPKVGDGPPRTLTNWNAEENFDA